MRQFEAMRTAAPSRPEQGPILLEGRSACTARAVVMSKWVAVASAEHVAIGRAQGVMQVGHGKRAPLRRLHSGERIPFYSPVRAFGTNDAARAFTAIGTVRDERVYQGVMRGGFEPFRRDVDWLEALGAPIRPLLEALSFTTGKSNWGYALRFGQLKVTDDDMALIATAMHTRFERSDRAPGHSQACPRQPRDAAGALGVQTGAGRLGASPLAPRGRSANVPVRRGATS
jgi:hypothetical protein